MTAHPTIDKASVIDAPLHSFEMCHADILSRLRSMAELPGLVVAANKARAIAADAIDLFAKSIVAHHADEEKELFPQVLADALFGDERDKVQAMVQRLVAEHRNIESAWKSLKPALQSAATGKPAELDAQAVAEFVLAYQNHAHFEEQQFLPLAAQILGRKEHHMEALGLGLLLRHTPIPHGYI